MSFLSPRDLCSGLPGQLALEGPRGAGESPSWERFEFPHRLIVQIFLRLSLQDCLWAGRCIRRGWFLPYTPVEKEYGAWKNHYVSCVSTLDLLTPREAAEQYGTLNQPSTGATEEEEERRKERRDQADDQRQATGGEDERLKASAALSSFTYRPAPPHTAPPIHRPSPALLLLISDRIPAYELLLCGVKAGVIVVLYDHRGTFSALLTQAERAISGQRVQRLGLVAPGGTDEIQLLHILSEWSGGAVCSGLSDQQPAAPALRFMCESVLRGWCTQAQWMEEALREMRGRLGAQLQRTRPLEFLAVFLTRWSEEKGGGAEGQWRNKGGDLSVAAHNSQKRLSRIPDLPQEVLDWRGAVARELHHSECVYVGRLGAVLKLKRSSERDAALEETQQMIQGCPRLSESNRQLIITQDAALLRSPDEQIPDSFRTYEQVSDVSFFLFNDALVLTRRTVQHTPFTLAHQSAHTFVASVALASLTVREITHSR
ncbi:Epithelial cell-transforming sequence 2 oncogene-like, partial [Larimichthys crocea]